MVLKNILSRELFNFIKCKLNEREYKKPIDFEMEQFLDRVRYMLFIYIRHFL